MRRIMEDLTTFGSFAGLGCKQIDVKTAFLNSVLPEEETVYMEQPKGFEESGKENWVCRLLKGLYSTKQAWRIWNKTLDSHMKKWGFTRLGCEACVYYRKNKTGTVIVGVHVDDFLAIASSKTANRTGAAIQTRYTFPRPH